MTGFLGRGGGGYLINPMVHRGGPRVVVRTVVTATTVYTCSHWLLLARRDDVHGRAVTSCNSECPCCLQTCAWLALSSLSAPSRCHVHPPLWLYQEYGRRHTVVLVVFVTVYRVPTCCPSPQTTNRKRSLCTQQYPFCHHHHKNDPVV